jgi:hypothetical protein
MDVEVFRAEDRSFRQAFWGAWGVVALTVAVMVGGAFVGTGRSFGVVVLFIFFVSIGAGAVTMPSVIYPMELRLDDGGLSLSARGNTTRILWDQLDEIRIVQGGITSEYGWLMAWPRQVPMALRRRLYHPEWKPDYSAVKVCDLDYFKGQAEEVRDAVRRFTGAKWNDSAEPR